MSDCCTAECIMLRHMLLEENKVLIMSFNHGSQLHSEWQTDLNTKLVFMPNRSHWLHTAQNNFSLFSLSYIQ